MYSIVYSQKYVSCLLFYESLESYNKTYQKYLNFEANSSLLDDSRLSIKTDTLRGNLHNSLIRNVPLSTRASTDMNLDSNLKFSYLTNTKKRSIYKNYFAPKCICLISIHPFMFDMSKILKDIYRMSKNPKLKKPIEKIIENLLIEVPVPPRGLFNVTYNLLSSEDLKFEQTNMNRLPVLNIELERLFKFFSLEQVFEIFKHVLMETNIIFFSSDISNLTPVLWGISNLIFPLKYPFQLVTVLSQEDYKIIESITPYIVGINVTYSDTFFEENNLWDISELNILIVDIDNKRLDINTPFKRKYQNSQTKYKKVMQEEFPELPHHYKRKLQCKLSEIFLKIKINEDKKRDDRTMLKINLMIQNAFFQFLVSILQNYNKFLNHNYYTNNDIGTPTVRNLFKVEEFINKIDSSDRTFYKKLVETQQFVEFILKRMMPKDSKEKLEILFFDENIIEKQNRQFLAKRKYTPFLNSQMYNKINVYIVRKHRTISEREIEYFKDSHNQREALKYGQEIHYDGEDILFSYPYFPNLMTKLFFTANNIKGYFIPPNLSDELESINIDIVSQSHLSKLILI